MIFVRLIFVFLFAVCAVSAQTVPRSECFPFERLAPEMRERAEALLLKALDSEALYTIAGDLKPMSSGFQSFRVETRLPRQSEAEAEKNMQSLGARKADELTDDEKRQLAAAKQTLERRGALSQIAETREILEKWRCGDALFADVQHFANVFEGKRFVEAVIFNRAALRRKLNEKAEFFSRWGVTANSHPLEVLYAVEYDKTVARFGGYGFLFGYPDYGVRFFVEAAASEEFTGKFVERDFYSIPTFARETNAFVWAVPKNHVETDADKNMRARAEKILAEYKTRRARFVGAGKPGVVEMMRDWFCDRQNQCALPATAAAKAASAGN
jgi:hypothetical protein